MNGYKLIFLHYNFLELDCEGGRVGETLDLATVTTIIVNYLFVH